VLLHVVCCAVTSGEKVDISCNVFCGVVCSKPIWDLVCVCVYMRMSCANGCVVSFD